MCFLTFSEFVFTRKRDAHYFFKASAKATDGRQGRLWTFWSGTARACGNCWCCSFPIWAQKSSRSWEKPWQDCEELLTGMGETKDLAAAFCVDFFHPWNLWLERIHV